MNKILAIGLSVFISFMTSANNDVSEQSMINASLRGDYQIQRNLAFSYRNGWGETSDIDYVPKDVIRSCAWRKIILLTNTKKADTTDYANESIDCKDVHPTNNVEVWSIVYGILNTMNNQK